MASRTAKCGCGRVQITVQDEPALVAACHCDFCQKRTGSAFGLNAYFSQAQCVALSGETKVFNGLEVDGVAASNDKVIDYHFCTTCGSTVYWTVEGSPGNTVLGIAVGNFVEPGFQSPMREYHTTLRHGWVVPLASAEQFTGFPEGQNRFQGL